ncbi:L-ectoine synthase [Meinhardsimonia xiamenensis]|jgi:L-ectoine synthase|uniref:L-ectoine synthase n=1 Tax=Meinhardsimonia xiamenensis TaxID=990712 RepID=A0A1G9H968_9RHOB|nr:ectoine synthase [Meinhardsimonia xiamenensis]PRX29389.1 L-ectoine synthase [Meinhardsimonia xiamenensis]SDL09439.1 L-ectoine synthase [Meinhardsimonia xiamenensis]
MIVRELGAARNSERHVRGEGWDSTRLILAGDGMGFSFHITRIHEGTSHLFHYRHHLESVYCIAGEGTIEDLATGQVHEIRPGVLYALDKHDRHRLTARSEMVMACCFNPPVTGSEVHRADGSYAPAEEVA